MTNKYDDFLDGLDNFIAQFKDRLYPAQVASMLFQHGSMILHIHRTDQSDMELRDILIESYQHGAKIAKEMKDE